MAYAKSKINVVFFKNPENSPLQNTDKVLYGRISEPVKTGKQTADGKDEYEYENWDARFVGNARAAAANLEDKARITITEWAVHPNYKKEKKQSFPYMMIMDFEVRKED